MIIDIKRLLKEQSDLFKSSGVLRTHLELLYPKYKGYINALMFCYDSGILSQMLDINVVDQLTLSKWMSFLTGKYFFDDMIARDSLYTWLDAIDTIKNSNITIEPKTMGEYLRYVLDEDFRVGDSFDFGKYYNVTGEIKVPVKWRIIDKKYDKILIVTDKAIDVLPFNSELSRVEWSDSDLKEYLNSTMINDLFSAKEKESITSTENSDHLGRLFLLTRDEAKRLFYDNDSRCCKVTEYALSKNPYMEQGKDFCIWWLRDTDTNRYGAYIVANDGSIGLTIGRVNSQMYGVRPACWLDVSKLSN